MAAEENQSSSWLNRTISTCFFQMSSPVRSGPVRSGPVRSERDCFNFELEAFKIAMASPVQPSMDHCPAADVYDERMRKYKPKLVCSFARSLPSMHKEVKCTISYARARLASSRLGSRLGARNGPRKSILGIFKHLSFLCFAAASSQNLACKRLVGKQDMV